jgi:hypothetical protein
MSSMNCVITRACSDRRRGGGSMRMICLFWDGFCVESLARFWPVCTQRPRAAWGPGRRHGLAFAFLRARATRPTDLPRVSRTWVAFQFLCNLNLCARRPVLLLHSAHFPLVGLRMWMGPLLACFKICGLREIRGLAELREVSGPAQWRNAYVG